MHSDRDRSEPPLDLDAPIPFLPTEPAAPDWMAGIRRVGPHIDPDISPEDAAELMKAYDHTLDPAIINGEREAPGVAAKIAELTAMLTELAPKDEVLVEDSYFARQDLPRILGNYMRAAHEAQSEAKAAERALAVERAKVAQAWDRGFATGKSRAMRHMSDEPNLSLDAANPYRAALAGPAEPEASETLPALSGTHQWSTVLGGIAGNRFPLVCSACLVRSDRPEAAQPCDRAESEASETGDAP